MSHQFKPGDRVLVGAPTEVDNFGDNDLVKWGAVGIVLGLTEKGSYDVQFKLGDPLVDPLGGDYRWHVDPRRMTLLRAANPNYQPVAVATKAGAEPAYPCQPVNASGCPMGPLESGFTQRQRAAIDLRVPDSGTPWLDEMIRQALRQEFAGKALQGLMSNKLTDEWSISGVSNACCEQADALLARVGGAK